MAEALARGDAQREGAWATEERRVVEDGVAQCAARERGAHRIGGAQLADDGLHQLLLALEQAKRRGRDDLGRLALHARLQAGDDRVDEREHRRALVARERRRRDEVSELVEKERKHRLVARRMLGICDAGAHRMKGGKLAVGHRPALVLCDRRERLALVHGHAVAHLPLHADGVLLLYACDLGEISAHLACGIVSR